MANMPIARKILMRRGGKCRYCGIQCHSRDPRHKHYGTVDHVIPKAKGGTGHIDNLDIACLECNRNKGTMPSLEFKDKVHKKCAKIESQNNTL